MEDINLKDEKRINVNGEYDLVTTHPNNEPIYRSNGHQLELNASNSDYIAVNEDVSVTTTDDIDLEISFIPNTFDSNTQYLFNKGISSNSSNTRYYLRRTSNVLGNAVYNFNINDNLGGFSQNINLNQTPIIDNQLNTITIKNRVITVNGVANTNLINSSTININDLQNALVGVLGSFSGYFDGSIVSLKYQGETFNPTNINSNAQIVGSNGTIAQVNSSAADPINYILGDVFQKSGFALVGNGTTQKILSPLGGEIILTSTPLEGGFDLDGKTYNLTEGLGNVIKSTDGTTESNIVGFSGTSLNFGGWQKGDNINGWNPYTV